MLDDAGVPTKRYVFRLARRPTTDSPTSISAQVREEISDGSEATNADDVGVVDSGGACVLPPWSS